MIDDISFPTPQPMTREEIESEIRYYEQKYGMSSEELLRQQALGIAPDNFDITDWLTLLKHRKLEEE